MNFARQVVIFDCGCQRPGWSSRESAAHADGPKAGEAFLWPGVIRECLEHGRATVVMVVYSLSRGTAATTDALLEARAPGGPDHQTAV